ncbi:helix-turn-helix domain-containing protein [Deinococcus hopiensis]|uniref:Predicted transcriptional regulators n=1 Tax=Deinococcus hopiensis KR-140 TaxID=695939 RepID=A0A1W1UY71_9DEIO|nr:helix-turn-helix transcriptional regulator [Deinococcus hopiensis]SMB85910.1 Predicted transcriptional regulators [Deinococcus hopiensis KR-140]
MPGNDETTTPADSTSARRGGGTLSAGEAGQRLRTYLRRLSMQQKELAAALGVDSSYVSRMVLGHINWTTGQYFGQIASHLRLTEAEIRELNPAAVVEMRSGQGGAGTPQGVDSEIPEALLEAGELYKHIDPRIADPQVQLALARAGFFGGGPQSPQDWIQYFNDIRQWLGHA